MNTSLNISSKGDCRRARIRIFRVLTLISFFHFSGLNNGFSFYALSPAQIQPVNFAPVFVRSLCSAVNPFHWGQVFKLRSWKRLILSSRRTLQFSSRTALRKYHPQILISKIGFRVSGLRIDSGRKDFFSSLIINSQSAPAPSPQSLAPSPFSSQNASWLKLEKLDFLDWDHNDKIFAPQGNRNMMGFREPALENRLKAGELYFIQASRPGFIRRNYVDADSEDSGHLLNSQGRSIK